MAVQKKPPRKNIPVDRETAVLINSGRRCVLCFHLNRDLEEKHGQIAHLDGDRTNRAEDNLAWMCLPHHSLFDSKTSQHKNYSLAEVKAARRNLYAAVQKGRHQESPSPRVSTRRYGHQDFIKIVTGPKSAEDGPALYCPRPDGPALDETNQSAGSSLKSFLCKPHSGCQAFLLPFRHKRARESEAERHSASATDIASFLGIDSRTVHVNTLGEQFVVSIKPDPGYSELVAYIFEFCSVRFDDPPGWMSKVDCEIQLEQSVRRFRWFHPEEMEQDQRAHAGRWRCDSRSSLFLCHYTPRRASIGAKRILAVAVANFHGHAAKHPNPHHFKLIHPRGTRATKALWLMLHKREARAYGQHQVVRFAILGPAVEPHGGVQADKVSVARPGRIPALVAVGAPAGHHVALAAENIIDLFLHLVVMGDVSAPWCEVHDEQAHHLAGCRQLVAPALRSPHQQLKQRGWPVAGQGHRRRVVRVCQHEARRWSNLRARRNAEAHHQQAYGRVRCIGDAMLEPNRQIHEVVLANGCAFIPV